MLTEASQAPAGPERAKTVVQDLYGIGIRTPWPLRGVPTRTSGAWDVEFLEGDAHSFDEARRFVPSSQAGRWAQSAALADGSRYRRWNGLFEFLVSPDGRRVRARALPEASEEAFLAYLLVDALSFSMVRLEREPLHASAVVTDGGVAAFLGASGDGKSTLAALFLERGFPLLTDDMLVVTSLGGTFLAHPGPPRIKLYRDIATRTLGGAGHGIPMNAETEKLIFPLAQGVPRPAPLETIYLLAEDHGRGEGHPATIRRLSPAAACPRILAGTAAHWAEEPTRLAHQFEFVTRLVERVPVKTLSYRRSQDDMFGVREAVLADLARQGV